MPAAKKKLPLKKWSLRYVATVRGTLEVEATTEEEARELANDDLGADFSTCEQTDFEVLSAREVRQP